MRLTDGVCDILVGNKPIRDEEPLSSRICHLDGLDVGQGYIPHVDIQVAVGAGLLVLDVALHKVLGSFARGVDGVQGVQVVHDRTDNQRRADCGNVKVGLFLFDKLPSRFFCERLNFISYAFFFSPVFMMDITLLPRYVAEESRASSQVTGFQFSSL